MTAMEDLARGLVGTALAKMEREQESRGILKKLIQPQ
jgi:hypothetical protein